MPKSAAYVSPQYLKMIANFIREFKNMTYKKMDLKSGDTVLDLGCGPASDTLELAKIVTPSGKVYGLDMDEEMVDLANEAAKKEKMDGFVNHICGSVESMNFEDDFFNCIRAERIFQVIPFTVDRQTIFQEIKRVLKPGGIFMALDNDWATASIDFPDSELERKLVNWLTFKNRPDGLAGRKFFRLLKETGFSNIKIETVVNTAFSLKETPFGDNLIKTAEEEQVITKEEGAYWLSTLKEKSALGTYYSSVNFVMVSGVK